MAQNFTTFTPIEEVEPSSAPKFTTFTPIEETAANTKWAGTVLSDKQLQQLEADANAGNANAKDILRAYKEAHPTGKRITQAQGEAARQLTGNAPPAPTPDNAGFFETVGANLGAGIANTGLGAAAALSDYTGFSDTAKSLDAKRKAVEAWQKEHGGESFTGKVASTVGSLAPALLAAPFTEGVSLIPLLTNVGAFAIPGFRDTFNAQKEAGASTAVAAEHALATAGFMLVGGKLIQTGGKVLPKALKAGETFLPSIAKKTVGQGAAATAEGAVFTAADLATQKAIDKANGIDTEAPWYDPAKMLETGAAFGVLRRAHMAIAPKAAKPTPDKGRVEPTLDKTAQPTAFKTFTPVEPTANPAVDAVAEQLRANGVPSETAQKMAEKQVAEQTKGAENVTGTEPAPSRESVGVVSEPSAVEPTGGPETPARDGMVPVEPDVGVPAAREVSEPATVETPVSETLPTEGAPASVTTPTETVKTETQGQEAPAAPVKAKHSIAQNADGKWDHLVNGEVVGTYDTKRQANTKAILERSIAKGNADVIAKNQQEHDAAMSAARGRPLKVIPKTEAKEGAPSEVTEPTAETAAPAAETELQNAPTETVEGQPAAGTTETVEGEKAPIVLQETKTTRGDPLTGSSTKVKLSDGSEHEINRQDTNSTMGLPGWHDVSQHAMYSYLGNTKAEAIQELIRRQEKKRTAAAAGTTETVNFKSEPLSETYQQILDRTADEYFASLEAKEPKTEAKTEAKTEPKAETEPKTEAPVEEPKAAKKLTKDEREEMALLESSLEKYNSSVDDKEASKHADFISSVARDTSAPKVVRERAKQMLDEEVDPKDIPSKSAYSSKFTQSPADKAFSKHTNAAQAVSHILRTGTKFQKALASRLRGFVQGVKFVVIEEGDPLPKGLTEKAGQWNRSIAMYDRADRTIYVRGESFGNKQGINHTTILHELLHAATARKIDLAMKAIKDGANLDSPLVQAALSLHRTMENADTALRESARKGELTEDLANLAVNGKAFSDLHEFLAYGMTDKTMQNFLLKTMGVERDTHLFNKFVDSVRRMFGMGKDSVNALSDLILATDQILSAREIGKVEETGTYSAIAPKEEQKELNKNVNKAIGKVKTSRDGYELGDATSNLAKWRDPRYLWGEIKGAWDALGYDARSRVSHFYDSEGLAYSGPGDLIPGLKDTHEAMQKLTGSVQSYLRGTANMADEVVNLYRAEPGKRAAFEDLVNATTLARYDPSNPKNPVRNAKLDAAYLALGEKGQQVYQRLRDYYRTMNAVKQHLLEENLSKLELSDDARRKLLSDIRLIFETDKIEPYFPLARFGDFILETGKTNTRATYRFDTMLERDRAAREYAAQQGKTVDELKSDGELKISNDSDGKSLRANIEGTSKLLKSAYDAIDKASITDPDIKQNLRDNLYQAYLAAMPENSVRKMFIHRKGTPGFSSDILRAVNDAGSRMGRAFAKLEHASDIRRGIELSRRQLEGQEQYTPFVKRMEEMAAEALQPKVPTDAEKWMDNAANTIVKLSFLRNLTSWSSAIMQPMDIVLKGVPVLTGNHGPKAMVELSKMMKLHNQYGVMEKMPNGTTRFRAPSIEFAKGLSPQERRAVRDMVDMYGVTRDTLANDVFSQAKKPSTKVDSKALELGKDAVNNLVLGGFMHHGERLSREVIALTSFRLHLAELQKAKPNDPTNYHEAVKNAVQETNEVLGNYSANNKPMMMRGATGRLVTMYKFFPLLTTKMLVGNFFKMLPGLNKQGKAAAATKFFGVLGSHALLGGLVALPAFSMVMGAMQAAWKQWQKDPDAPDEMRDIDYETWWRTEWLPKYFGDAELARTAEYGLANKLTGWDISSRISLNDMWFRDPQPGKTLTDTFLNWGQVLGGAAASTALGAAQGVQLMSQGEYERGLEKLTPASISKLLMAHRYATEGIQTSQGAQLAEKGIVPTSELTGQAIGYAPARVAEAQNIAFKTQAAEKVITRERQNIMGTLKDSFRKSIDFNRPDVNERFDKIFQDTLDKAVDFSLRHPEYGIKDEEINKAINDELKKVIETEMDSGVRLTKKNFMLSSPSAEKAENALAPYKK